MVTAMPTHHCSHHFVPADISPHQGTCPASYRFLTRVQSNRAYIEQTQAQALPYACADA